jgi:hypothetical protein
MADPVASLFATFCRLEGAALPDFAILKSYPCPRQESVARWV